MNDNLRTVYVNPKNAFTLFEACPEARCRDSQGAPALDFAPPTCPKCGGERGRVTMFGSLAELREYAPPTW
jgi:hypothetical protein